jgi:hypothetical protein
MNTRTFPGSRFGVRFILPAFAIHCACAAAALAGFNGHPIQMTEYQGTSPSTPVGGVNDFGTRVVGPGPENYALTGWIVDISDATIRMDAGFSFNFATSNAFFGDAFFDVNSTVDPISGVSLASTNISGFDAAHLTFDADHVYFNFANLSLPTGSFVQANVQFVPEPSTAAGFVIVAAGLSRRARGRRAAAAVQLALQ